MMSPFPTCKITVLKTLYHQDLADEYRRPDIHQGPCPFFKSGDEFTVNYRRASTAIGPGMISTRF